MSNALAAASLASQMASQQRDEDAWRWGRSAPLGTAHPSAWPPLLGTSGWATSLQQFATTPGNPVPPGLQWVPVPDRDGVAEMEALAMPVVPTDPPRAFLMGVPSGSLLAHAGTTL